MARSPHLGPAAALAAWRHRLAGWARRQPVLRALGAVWSRLLGEACDLLAPAVSAMGRDRRLVAVPRAGTGFDLYRITRAGAVAILERDVGRLRGRVELRLRADQLLERRLELPSASRDYLATIIDHRLDRLTPWRRDRVVHGSAVAAETDGGATLQVRVVLASADLVEGLLASLRDLGLEAAEVGTDAEHPASPCSVRLGRDRAAQGRPAWQARLGTAWLACAIGSCGLAAASLAWAAAADGRRLEAERHLVKARRLIREAADGAGPSADPAFGDKRAETATVVLIDTLATTLPDTTYLRELSLTPREVRLAGTSADAPALIPLIEKAGFHDVRFTAPVSRGDDRKDAFEITAERAPATPEAP